MRCKVIVLLLLVRWEFVWEKVKICRKIKLMLFVESYLWVKIILLVWSRWNFGLNLGIELKIRIILISKILEKLHFLKISMQPWWPEWYSLHFINISCKIIVIIHFYASFSAPSWPFSSTFGTTLNELNYSSYFACYWIVDSLCRFIGIYAYSFLLSFDSFFSSGLVMIVTFDFFSC